MKRFLGVSMSDILTVLLVIGGWVAIQYFILPKLGVPT
jgi:hypothetical protein